MTGNKHSYNEVTPQKAEQASVSQSAKLYHKVAHGETLYSISRKRGVSVDTLCKLNNIGKNFKVRTGQMLRYS